MVGRADHPFILFQGHAVKISQGCLRLHRFRVIHAIF